MADSSKYFSLSLQHFSSLSIHHQKLARMKKDLEKKKAIGQEEDYELNQIQKTRKTNANAALEFDE